MQPGHYTSLVKTSEPGVCCLAWLSREPARSWGDVLNTFTAPVLTGPNRQAEAGTLGKERGGTAPAALAEPPACLMVAWSGPLPAALSSHYGFPTAIRSLPPSIHAASSIPRTEHIQDKKGVIKGEGDQ